MRIRKHRAAGRASVEDPWFKGIFPMREGSYAAPRHDPASAGPGPAAAEPMRNLFSLALFARLGGLDLSPAALARRFASAGLDVESPAMVRALGELGFAPVVRQGGWAELARESMPVLAQLRDGSLLAVAAVEGMRLRIVRGGHLQLEPRDPFVAEWNGRWIVVKGLPERDSPETLDAVERVLQELRTEAGGSSASGVRPEGADEGREGQG